MDSAEHNAGAHRWWFGAGVAVGVVLNALFWELMFRHATEDVQEVVDNYAE